MTFIFPNLGTPWGKIWLDMLKFESKTNTEKLCQHKLLPPMI